MILIRPRRVAMKYFPLIWAALWRRPAHTILTFLSVIAAFTLFGIMIGFNASVERIANGAVRTGFMSIPRLQRRLAAASLQGPDSCACLASPGSAIPAALSRGYYQDTKNRARYLMVDEMAECHARPEYNTPRRAGTSFRHSRTGVFVTRGSRSAIT